MLSVSPNFAYTPSAGDQVVVALSRSNRNAFSDSAKIECAPYTITPEDVTSLEGENMSVNMNLSCFGGSETVEFYVAADIRNAAGQITQSYRFSSSDGRRAYPALAFPYILPLVANPEAGAGTGSSTGGGSPYGY
jgi:hypothetical protein